MHSHWKVRIRKTSGLEKCICSIYILVYSNTISSVEWNEKIEICLPFELCKSFETVLSQDKMVNGILKLNPYPIVSLIATSVLVHEY